MIVVVRWWSLFVAAVLVSNVVADEVKHDRPPPGVKLEKWQEVRLPPPLSVRRAKIKPVAEGELRLRPTFNSCGVAWGAGKDIADISFEYRKYGDVEWQIAPRPLWFYETKDIRGSILYLAEDTAYDFRARAKGMTVAEGKFHTWASEVPVAETVTIDPATAKYPIVIDRKGSAKGWIRYTTKSGAIVGGKDLMSRIFMIKDAEYVLLDDMIIVGGGGWFANPVRIADSHNVRVRNCEFYGWGRVGPPNFEKFENGTYGGGKFIDYTISKPNKPPTPINYDCAVCVSRGSSEVVIERCYAHDPRGRANSWFYSHPAGPDAVLMDSPEHSCVIRYCDFIGSDNHRFNDAVESSGNSAADGGFNQDADIYGNFMIYCNDDNIELDGGQQNVRCFQNRFEAAVSGVSIQGCCASPVYVFDNLFSGMGEEFGLANPSIKTASFSPWWYAPYAGVWGNVYQDVKDFCPKQGTTARWDIRDNVRMVNPDQKTLSATPVRPLGYVLNTGRIAGVKVTGNTLVPSSVTVTVKSVSDKAESFKVRQNFDADWFEVSPKSGVVQAGGEVKLTVSFKADKMTTRRQWRSAFIVQAPNGLSRVVSVLGERTDLTTSERPLPASDDNIYAASSGTNQYEYSFDIKKSGRYWFYVLAQASDSDFPLSDVIVDGVPLGRMGMFLYSTHATWSMIRPGKKSKFSGVTTHFDLQAGNHRLELKPRKGEKIIVTGAVATTNPLAFEPK